MKKAIFMMILILFSIVMTQNSCFALSDLLSTTQVGAINKAKNVVIRSAITAEKIAIDVDIGTPPMFTRPTFGFAAELPVGQMANRLDLPIFLQKNQMREDRGLPGYLAGLVEGAFTKVTPFNAYRYFKV